MQFEMNKNIGMFSKNLNKCNSNSLAFLSPCKLTIHPHLFSGLDSELCLSAIIMITK